MFQVADLRERVERERLGFWPLGDAHGDFAGIFEKLGQLQGMRGVRFTIAQAARLAHVVFDFAPAAFEKAGIDLAIIDQNEPAGASVAQHLKLRYVSIAPSLPLNREAAIPPPFMDWPYSDTTIPKLRNGLGYAIADFLLRPLTSVVNRQRGEWGLPPFRSPNDSFSTRAQLCTLPKELDFPRHHLPPNFHYTGPFVEEQTAKVEFPWERLDGRPLVYASFGTLQIHRPEQFQTVVDACADLPLQLVLSTGGGEMDSGCLKGNPIVVSWAPQRLLLARAAMAVSHAGLNTVLDCMSFGVPMVTVPVTNDQPAIAARVRHAGAGELIAANRMSATNLRESIHRVLTDDRYRTRARSIQKAIETAGGVEWATNIIEQQLTPVPA